MINDLLDIISKIIIEKNENYKFDFWKQLIDSKIDIENADSDEFNKKSFYCTIICYF